MSNKDNQKIVDETLKRSAYNVGDKLRNYKNAHTVKEIIHFAKSMKDDLWCQWVVKGFEGAHLKEADRGNRFNELQAIFEKKQKEKVNDQEQER